MSENKRNRRYGGQNKDPKRPIILAKKEDRDGREHEISVKSTQETPKILLKTKEKEIVVPATPMQISIAARPSDLGNDQHKYMQSTKTSILPASRDPKDQLNVEHPNLANIPLMKKPLSIINDHYQINSHAFDYLIETNADFLVVGIIGTQGSGKSSILNLLIDDVDGNRCNSKRTNIDDSFSFENDGVFKTRRSKEFIFSNMPATEGIQMYITRDRTILLDCSPVLCNPYKKDGILNELDDLKMLIFLLSVCHLLIVVEDNGFNMNFLRLLQCAENMKIDCSDKNRSGTYSPIILFFKNKCAIRDFLPGTKQRFNQIYIESFKDSKLKINAINYANCDRKMHRDRLNAFHFPLIDTNRKHHYAGHPDISLLIAEFRQRVFMSPRIPFSEQNLFTEKNWSHLALGVWESHKNNYFLRKYETFKEKEWTTRL